MGSRSCKFKYATERGTVAAFMGIRLLGSIAVILAGCLAAGCISTQLKVTSDRPVEASMEIFAHALVEQHAMERICVLPFVSPPEMDAACAYLTTAYQARLVQRRPFREIMVLPVEVKSDSEALWYARNDGCTLVMCPSLIYMMDGTGNMPTELVVRSRILDCRTGAVLWDVKQRAASEPGRDIDLTWNTFEGKPAQRCRVLADCLARRFAEYLAPPPEPKK